MKQFDAMTTHPFRDEDVESCMIHFGMSRDKVLQRLYEREHQVKRLWEAAGNPTSVEDQREWYSTTDAHIFEGLAWHSQSTQRAFREAIARRCSTYCDPLPVVLDYGCGVATEGIIANIEGAHVEFVDYQNMLDFVKTRLSVESKYMQSCTSFACIPLDTWQDTLIYDRYDVIICLDVLEHLSDPESALKTFRHALKPDGLFIGSAPFSELQWVGHLKKHNGKLLSKMCDEAGINNYLIDPIRPTWKCGIDT